MSDAVHARGCHDDGRASALLPGYIYCPTCRRMVADQEDDHGNQASA